MPNAIKKSLASSPWFSKAELEPEQGGMVAVARGFNASILWAIGLGLLIVASLGVFSDRLNLLITAAVILLLGVMQFFLLQRWLKTSSVLILLVLFAGVFFSMYRFGSITIAQASLSCIPIIYCVVILGVKAGAVLLALSIAGTAAITWGVLFGYFGNPSPTIPQAQWVVLTVGFIVAFRLAILFKRHLVDANIRINATQELLLQERTRQNAELEVARQAATDASHAKSEFLANMSHELRTPMNGVIGMVDVLRATPLKADQQRMVETIHQSSHVLLKILNDVLDFSKIEAGYMAVEHIPMDVRDLVAGLAQLMEPVARRQGIDFDTTVDADVPHIVLGDATRLTQVLLNLLGNAMKFTPTNSVRKGAVQLRLQRIEGPESGSGLAFKVIDNGIGIRAQDISRLFEPFVQADASTARKFGGTGLGLSISRQLVEKMNGRLLVQSTLGLGSEFVVQVPLLPTSMPMHGAAIDSERPEAPDQGPLPASIQSEVQTKESARFNKKRGLILLAEDNATNLAVMQEQLGLLGYQSETAGNGRQALSMWRSGRFSLVLTDCQMPEMDGFELTRQIRQQEANHEHTIIVAVTANALQGQAKRCLDSGMDDWLTKPLRLLELSAMMSKWLPDSDAVASKSTHAVWDASVLTTIVGEDWAIQTRLLETFLLNSNIQVAELVQASTTQDFNAMAKLCHTLKSACQTVGAMWLGQICSQIEAATLAKDVKACHEAVSSAQAAMVKVEETIRARLAMPLPLSV
jgi:signal transduction histidine kinase/CheY-like chemotaxis protein